MRWLLDTNAVSDLLRHPGGRVRDLVAEVGEEAVFTSAVVAAELRFGASKRGSQPLSERVEAVLAALPVEPFGPPADVAYGAIRAELERNGTPIGANDLLIAAQALASGAGVVTADVGEFGRVPGLVVRDWTVPAATPIP